MASRSLHDLNSKTQLLAEAFLHECNNQGLDILIYCTYRSPEEQDKLYAIGRTEKGKIVTNARGGDSYHNHRCAFDFVPILAGKPQWDNAALYSKAGIIAEEVGLEWSGRWTGKLRETAHCQFRDGKTLEQMKKEMK